MGISPWNQAIFLTQKSIFFNKKDKKIS